MADSNPNKQKAPGNREHFEEMMKDPTLDEVGGARDQDDSQNQRGTNIPDAGEMNLNPDSGNHGDGTRSADIRAGRTTNRSARQGGNDDARNEKFEDDPDVAL